MLFIANSDSTINMLRQKWRFVRPGNIFLVFNLPVLVITEVDFVVVFCCCLFQGLTFCAFRDVLLSQLCKRFEHFWHLQQPLSLISCVWPHNCCLLLTVGFLFITRFSVSFGDCLKIPGGQLFLR